MKIESQFFGDYRKFKIGDVVSWTKIGERDSGIISNLEITFLGGRKVTYATVFCFKKRLNQHILCVNLKLMTKNASSRVEN
jgi:hypothetical protein